MSGVLCLSRSPCEHAGQRLWTKLTNGTSGHGQYQPMEHPETLRPTVPLITLKTLYKI